MHDIANRWCMTGGHDQRVFEISEGQKLGKGKRRQEEVREPARTGFMALESQRGRSRSRNDETGIRVPVGQHLQMNFPILQVLDFIENDNATARWIMPRLLLEERQWPVQRHAAIRRRVNRFDIRT